jgi:hypothetical protein
MHTHADQVIKWSSNNKLWLIMMQSTLWSSSKKIYLPPTWELNDPRASFTNHRGDTGECYAPGVVQPTFSLQELR